ncbi:MAG: insulinase family protein [Caldilineaceae bacterium]|nr:insulinase family protein [Caldilineaceae bacterium]
MTLIHGFAEIRDEWIDELNTRARIFRHAATGATVLSMENDDENKVFGVSFRTPPVDSTGIAHILEHAVLGGSQKYPLKEPFVQLIKGSLKTFLNAFTSPDKTTYPVASQNLQDFYNLVDVYLDAVFHPLITPNHLAQEGWHYEVDEATGALRYKGVVYNEMKGVYSSPDSLFYRYTQQALFPDTTYGLDSGGDPAVIPELTYDQFRTFHATYYHPANARIFFYGDDPVDERLRRLDAVLADFGPLAVDGTVALQPPFAEPVRLVKQYGVDEGDDTAKKTMTAVAWALPEIDDPAAVMGLSVLSYALVGTQASPLRKKLVDSGLGEDVYGGFGTGLRQPTFRVVMKGMEADAVDAFEELLLTTLADLAATGIEEDMIEAAVNSIEFDLRENNTGAYPRGLSLFMRALSTWLYDQDPLAPLAFAAPLAAVKEALADADYLPRLIRTYLLDNTHRVTLAMEPDPTVNQARDEAEQARLDAARATMSDADIVEIREQMRTLQALQQTPDTPAQLALLPSLQLTDLDPHIKTVPSDEQTVDDTPVLYHDLFTNGIVYLDLVFDMHVLPQELLPYAVFFAKAMTKLGTATEDYVKLSRRIDSKTGGVYATDYTLARHDSDRSEALFLVRGKSTVEQAPALLDILRDILLTTDLDQQARFRQVVLETKARLEAGLVPSGHSYVNSRLRAQFSEAGWVEEMLGGIDYLYFVRRLAQEVEIDWPGVREKLEAVRALVINRDTLRANVTLDAENWQAIQPQFGAFAATLPAQPSSGVDWARGAVTPNQGLAIPAQVNYVGKGGSLYDVGYTYHGSINVITNLVRTSWLWDTIRAQGGAYGAFCRFGKQSGVWTYLSYRDPNLTGTLANYDGTAAFLRDYDLSDDELTKSIIGAIGSMDGHQLPDAKGFSAFTRHLAGITDAERQQTRDDILSTTQAHIRAFADVLEAFNAQANVVVMGSGDALRAANQEAGGNWLAVEKVM